MRRFALAQLIVPCSWKTRFFSLEGPALHYYDKRGGNHLGTIPILYAEIGRQHKDSSIGPQDDKAYRHALLIIEAKKANGAMGLKHVLCAESDQERDAWVAELLKASNKSQMASDSSAGIVKSSPTPLPRQSTSSSLVSDNKGHEQDPENVGAVPITSRPIPTPPPAQSTGSSIASSPSNNELARSLPTELTDAVGTIITDRSRQSGLPNKGPSTSSAVTNSPGRMKRQSVMPLRYQALSQEKESSHTPLSKISSSTSGKLQEAEATIRITRDMISGPSNGTPLPAGFRFGKESNERERKAKSMRLWGFGAKGEH